jgi:hypothetical protein
VIIVGRMRYGFTDGNESCKVHDGNGPILLEAGLDGVSVTDVPHDQRAKLDSIRVAGGKVVVDNRFISGGGERLASMATNIAGTSGDENTRKSI